ncbi:MAG TPA: hybrid sensor histidine kinase/response regulator [Polyangia bacterium]|jgi:signal transduction histidine kinase
MTSTSLALLVVEDSADDLELLTCELRDNGLEPAVRQVQTRTEMAAALQAGGWDAICMDYQLPSFDAPSALALRAELAPDVPVVIVSGFIGETAAVALLKAGADDYIPKGNLVRLAPALRRAMRDAEERRARRRAEEDRARLVTQLEGALRLRDDFLVLASHELRTPLTALRLQIEAASRARGDRDAVLRRLERSGQSIDRIARLVDDMLVVSRVRPPDPIQRHETDVGRLVAALVASVAAQDSAQNLTVHVPREPLVARLDPFQLEDALRRLLENAVKYGLERAIDVHVERIGSSVRASVTDRGIGIAPEHQARIFERFGHQESTSNYGGLGLGLWIARRIVEAHGGTLTVASRLGEGATFAISIPIAP